MNPCPCGLADNEDGSCRCSPDMIRRYRQGASGPLMDRIDLHVKLSKPSPEALLSAATTDKVLRSFGSGSPSPGSGNCRVRAA